MSRLAPQQDVIRALFALSGNQCAFPGCTHGLISDKGTFIAQLCHIEAANKGGQRYNPDQSNEERRSQANLLLLCYAHHRETDDETEYTTDRLKEIKKNHEQQFKNQYELPENLVEKVLGSIEVYLEQITALSQDTNIVVHKLEEQMSELLKRNTLQPTAEDDKPFISQLEFIRELMNRGSYKTAIDKLLDFKEKNWDNLNPELKYKTLRNLGMIYLDLHDKSNACIYLLALKDIPYETAESLAILCLGYAISGKYQEFDMCFEKALKEDPENINLWVGYIERYKKIKKTDALLKELPPIVADSIPVLFSIGGMLIDEGRKKEGIALLKKTLDKQGDSAEKNADTRAMIATRILQDIVNPFKFIYNHFFDEELQELQEAKTLLTEAWETVADTEMAAFKWYMILNLGVINKLSKQNNQALLDFQKAFDLSREFLPFKNLLLMHMQVSNLSMVEELLAHTSIAKPLNEEELFEVQTFKARLLCLRGNFRDGLALLTAELDESNEKRYAEIMVVIIGTCFEYDAPDEAIPWCEKLIQKLPSMMTGYLLSGYLWTKLDESKKALEFYTKAETLLIDSTPQNEIYELASGYLDHSAYEKAIPLFERLANKNRLNSFSRGLILAYYQYGDLQAALAIAENLLLQHPGHPYLAEIISNIHYETKQYDKAIAVIETFLPSANGNVKDIFTFRLARLYSLKRDWESTRRLALQVEQPGNFHLNDAFILSSLLIHAGETEKGLEIAFDARTRFFDNSAAHLKYIQVCISVEKENRDLFPLVVRSESAVVFKTENGEEKTFLITNKNAKGANAIKPDDTFALQLIGKAKGKEILINKGFGFSYAITIIDILDIYTHAFRESMQLFETRFAGEQNIGVFHADPGQPGDQLEQFIKESTQDRNGFQNQIYAQYDQRKATIGVLAGVFKRNSVMQWFALLSSPDVSVICFSQNEYPAIDYTVQNNTTLVLDLTALLTMFFISRDNNFFSQFSNKYIVSQSTIDELQACFEELERGAKDGIFMMGYEGGQLVGHSTAKETVQGHREILQNIISWCREHTHITTSNKLLQVKRDERERMSEILGYCFYETLLLAEEHSAAVVSDDDNFKNVLRSANTPAPFSTYQLVHYLAGKETITNEAFDLFRMQLILANHVFVPLTAEQLWQCFDNTGFQLGKPFTVAVKGLIVMRPEFCAQNLTQFLKKLYLESGLATTKEQTILYVLREVSRRHDFADLKKLLILTIAKEFAILQTSKDDILQLLKAF